METVAQRYRRLCREESDISEHLPRLHELASQCGHVTEIGVRGGNSTTALLHAQPAMLVCIDIKPCPVVDELKLLAGNTAFRFWQADSLAIEIEPTAMLFIDTLHTYKQLTAELARHAEKVRQWIVLHDTTLFGERGEDRGPGLWRAVEEFLGQGAFTLRERLTNQNGLTTLERIA